MAPALILIEHDIYGDLSSAMIVQYYSQYVYFVSDIRFGSVQAEIIDAQNSDWSLFSANQRAKLGWQATRRNVDGWHARPQGLAGARSEPRTGDTCTRCRSAASGRAPHPVAPGPAASAGHIWPGHARATHAPDCRTGLRRGAQTEAR